MRAALLLLVVLLAFLAVRWFRPLPSGAAGSQGTVAAAPAAEAGVRFLPAPSPPSPRDPGPGAAPLGASGAEPSPAPTALEPTPAWPASLVVEDPAAGDELGVASALVHGPPSAVQAAVAELPRDRALLLESFAWTLAGERQMAISLSGKIANREGLAARERALFEAALTGKAATPAGAAGGPVVRAMEIGLLAREAKELLEGRDYPAAASAYSALLVAEVGAPWAPGRARLAEWTAGLDAAQREHRWNPRAAWPSQEVKVQDGDSLIQIRKRFLAEHPGAFLCTGLIERANRLKGFLQPGQVLRIPLDSPRILVDLEARWALYFLGEEVAAAWPVGIGRPGEDTPPGDYTVRNKLENPPWMKEGQEPIPFGDPRNPLGTRWMGWNLGGQKTSYGFHGTWEPESIGQAASDGCVRLLNQDVEELFQILPEGCPIRIQP